MNKYNISVGTILKDIESDARYRVIYLHSSSLVLCKMDIDMLDLTEHSFPAIIDLLSHDKLVIEEEECACFDKNNLSQSLREKFEKHRKMMQKISDTYGPTYLGLMGKKKKPEIKSLIEENQISNPAFWKICRKYLQSGMQEISLVDAKAFGVNKGKEYDLTSKPGRVPDSQLSGLVLTDEIRGYFDEALEDYKKGRHKTFRNCFDKMNALHFMEVKTIDGVPSLSLKPESERPTFRQFYTYAHKHITKQEIDKIKTSAREQRNNKRLLVSDSLYGVNGPGDMVEIDACEADVSLVSVFDENKTVGRPIVYFMIDVYSRIILAASIAFDNNSALGLTNLFLNLADNKQEYCQRYGMNFDNPDMWPSNIIPKRVRIDHGAEFKGKQFERICEELNIERIFAPVATGSMKGVVEQSFRQMHLKQNVHLEKHGLIEKRYDSKHHTQSTLNIVQYTRMVINFILTHNQTSISGYPVTKDMIENKVQPIPITIWNYGVNKYGAPRPIINKEQYLFNLMTPVKAKLTKRGICYKDLWYLPSFTDDKQISREMFNAGTKKVPFEVRMDMRNVGQVYYIRDGKLITAPLNALLNGNADYSDMTMFQYEEYLHAKRAMIAEGKVHNEALSAFNYALNHTVVDEVKKIGPSDKKNLRESRKQEKQLISSSNQIKKRLPEQIEAPVQPKALPETKPAEPVEKEYENFDEALEDMWDNF